MPTDQPPAAFASLPRSVQEAMAACLAVEIVETLDRLAVSAAAARTREGVAYDVALASGEPNEEGRSTVHPVSAPRSVA